MPCLRRICATGTPASPSFRIATICDSLNFDFFIGLSSTENPARKVHCQLSTGRGSLRLILQIVADNHNDFNISQIWNVEDILSATLTAGSYWAVYNAPFGSWEM